GAGSVESRHASVQNAMFTMGLVPAMPVSRVALSKGADVTLPVSLDRGACVTFVAIGDGSARDIELSILDSAGEELARESALDVEASVQLCPSESGEFGLRLGAVGGSAKVLVAGYRDEGGSRRAST